MGNIESRVGKLEAQAGSNAANYHVPGVKSVKFEPLCGRDGFYLEALKAPLRPSGKFVPISAAERERTNRLAKELQGLDREAQAKLAERNGYRVIYPSGPRINR